jgi:hypothetical protein
VSDRDDVTRRWRQGEERLYPVATVRPDLYERCIGLVRGLADHLGAVPDIDALVTTYRATPRDTELEQAGVERRAVPPEVDLDLVRDAAYAVRHRELTQRESTEQAQVLIRRARTAGERTVTIWARGDRDLWPPYRRVEMSLDNGHAVSVTTEMDPDTMMPRYAVEGLVLDPETGEAADEPPLAPRREFSDAEAWRSAAEDLRKAFFMTKEE